MLLLCCDDDDEEKGGGDVYYVTMGSGMTRKVEVDRGMDGTLTGVWSDRFARTLTAGLLEQTWQVR